MEIPIAASFKKAAAKASRTASMRRRQTRGLRHRRRPRQLLQCRRMMLECWMAVRVGASWAASLSCGTHYRNGTLPVPLKNAACPMPFFRPFFIITLWKRAHHLGRPLFQIGNATGKTPETLQIRFYVYCRTSMTFQNGLFLWPQYSYPFFGLRKVIKEGFFEQRKWFYKLHFVISINNST